MSAQSLLLQLNRTVLVSKFTALAYVAWSRLLPSPIEVQVSAAMVEALKNNVYCASLCDAKESRTFHDHAYMFSDVVFPLAVITWSNSIASLLELVLLLWIAICQTFSCQGKRRCAMQRRTPVYVRFDGRNCKQAITKRGSKAAFGYKYRDAARSLLIEYPQTAADNNRQRTI